jgi:hypothetical protein
MDWGRPQARAGISPQVGYLGSASAASKEGCEDGEDGHPIYFISLPYSIVVLSSLTYDHLSTC